MWIASQVDCGSWVSGSCPPKRCGCYGRPVAPPSTQLALGLAAWRALASADPPRSPRSCAEARRTYRYRPALASPPAQLPSLRNGLSLTEQLLLHGFRGH